jgi:hypothetical protein
MVSETTKSLGRFIHPDDLSQMHSSAQTMKSFPFAPQISVPQFGIPLNKTLTSAQTD